MADDKLSRELSDVSIELETFLEARNKKSQAAEVRSISNLVRNLAYVRQGEPLGLGHAVLTARPLVGNEPFAVILADDVIDAEPPALAQMAKVFEEVDGPVILVERVPKSQISGYGVIAAEEIRPGVYKITDLVEKPAADKAPNPKAERAATYQLFDPPEFTLLKQLDRQLYRKGLPNALDLG